MPLINGGLSMHWNSTLWVRDEQFDELNKFTNVLRQNLSKPIMY